jgi:flagellar hook-length control protein FliK
MRATLMTHKLTGAETQPARGEPGERAEKRAQAEDFASLLAVCGALAQPPALKAEGQFVPEHAGQEIDAIECAPPPNMFFDPLAAQLPAQRAGGMGALAPESFPPAAKLSAAADSSQGSLAEIVSQMSPTGNGSVNMEACAIVERDSAPKQTAEAPPTLPDGKTVAMEKDWAWHEEIKAAAEEAGAADSTEMTGAIETPRTETAQREAISLTSLLAEASRGDKAARGGITMAQALGETYSGAPQRQASGEGESFTQETMNSTALETASPSAAAAAGAPALEATARDIITQSLGPLIALAESLARRESRTLRVRLRPEELGEVELQVTRDAQGRLSAHLAAAQETARDALAHGLGHLRAALERAGIAFERLEVSSDARLNPGPDGQRQGASERRPARDADTQSLALESQPVNRAHAAPDDRLLNLRA